MDDEILKRELLKPGLHAASFGDGQGMLGVFASAPNFLDLVVEVGLENVDSKEKGDYRIVLSVLNAINGHTLGNKRWPEIPSAFFPFLGKALEHHTKTVRKRALAVAVNIAAVLYMELRTSGQQHQRELLDEFAQISPAYFQGPSFVNFLRTDWVGNARWAGWRYQDTLEENIQIMEEILGSIWPNFNVNQF